MYIHSCKRRTLYLSSSIPFEYPPIYVWKHRTQKKVKAFWPANARDDRGSPLWLWLTMCGFATYVSQWQGKHHNRTGPIVLYKRSLFPNTKGGWCIKAWSPFVNGDCLPPSCDWLRSLPECINMSPTFATDDSLLPSSRFFTYLPNGQHFVSMG